MKKIIIATLFFALLLFSVTAYAASPICTCGQSQRVASLATYQPVFTNPHSGWVIMPVETRLVRCSARL